MGAFVTTLHIGVDRTTVTRHANETEVESKVLSIGSVRTASDFFKHSPPTPQELENAIMAVEDEVSRARTLAASPAVLLTSDASIRGIALQAGIAEGERMVLPIEAVETLFDLLAAFVMGRPASSAGIPTDSRFAATLLVLREFMHHLQFPAITIELGRRSLPSKDL